MGILGSKDKVNTTAAEESPKEVRRKHVELLGKEFRIVKDGLDPQEVVEFLEASVGSSEAAFKHLEQFSAFQSVARTMEESIREAKYLAEQAKAKARLEADREKARAVAEVQQQSSAILDQTMRSCITSVEGIHSVILDAVARSEEIQHEAFQKVREMVATNLADIRQNIQAIVDGQYGQAESDDEADEDSLELPVKSEDTTAFGEAEDYGDDEADEDDEGPVFDMANLQESLMSLELSLSNLNERKNALGPAHETQVNVLEKDEDEEGEEEDEEGEEEEQEREEQPVDVEDQDDSPQDTVRQYCGEVTVQIIGGAEESWMQELRERMLNLPGARIRAESGVDERTTMVSLSLGEPVRLFPVLLSLPKVNRVVPGRLNGGKDGMKLRLWPKSNKNSVQNTITVELHSNGQTRSTAAESDDESITAG
jgi:hypothetical protein